MKGFLRIITLLIVGVIVVVLVRSNTDVEVPENDTAISEEVISESEDGVVTPEEEVVVPEEVQEDVSEEENTLPPGWQEDGTVILGGDGIPNN